MDSQQTQIGKALPYSALAGLKKLSDPWILLDSASCRTTEKTYLFSNPVDQIAVYSIDKVAEALRIVTEWSRDSWVCGYAAYECAAVCEEKLTFSAAFIVGFGFKGSPSSATCGIAICLPTCLTAFSLIPYCISIGFCGNLPSIRS